MNYKRDWDIITAYALPLIGLIVLVITTYVTEMCTGWCGLGAAMAWVYGSAILGALGLIVSTIRFGLTQKRHLWFAPHLIGFASFAVFAILN